MLAHMVSVMKMTINISDALYKKALKLAVEQRTTLKALVEEGLRRIIAERQGGTPFKLRKATFRGKRLQPDVKHGGWQGIRDSIYEGRGG
jgi:hypothetical protein